MINFSKCRSIIASALAVVATTTATTVWAQDTINVYSPGGPAPAMQEAAKAFGAAHHVTVNVSAGPTGQWVEKAKQDVVFSGAENMMTDFAKALPGAFDLVDAQPLHLRPVAILVRPGNPKGIRGFRDLLVPGVVACAPYHVFPQSGLACAGNGQYLRPARTKQACSPQQHG